MENDMVGVGVLNPVEFEVPWLFQQLFRALGQPHSIAKSADFSPSPCGF